MSQDDYTNTLRRGALAHSRWLGEECLLDYSIVVESTDRQLILCEYLDVGSRAFTNLFDDLPAPVTEWQIKFILFTNRCKKDKQL